MSYQTSSKRSPPFWLLLSIQPKIPVIPVATSNETDHFGLVRPEYSGPALKVVLFDRSGHFGRSDRNVPFHLTKLLSPVPLFCILLARTITSARWLGSGLGNQNVPFHWTRKISEISNREFLLNGKRPWSCSAPLFSTRLLHWFSGGSRAGPPLPPTYS